MDHNYLNAMTSSRPWTEETTAPTRALITSPPLPSSSDPPGDSLPTLPFDLVEEILCRLPVKFLLQFQSVCKSWKFLISHPKFIKKHLRVSTTLHLILTFTNPSREFTLMSYPLPSLLFTAAVGTQLHYPLNNRNRFDMLVGSCNGILCFSLNQKFVFLWNPSTRKFNTLPELQNPHQQGSYTIYGFGSHHLTDEFKVVAVFCYEFGTHDNLVYKNEVKVHTLGTDCWRRIQEFPYGVPFDGSGKYVNGTLNWLASKDLNSPWVIVSLDMGNESYRQVLPPDYGERMPLVTFTLGVLRDCLCILCHSDTFSDIWVMQNYENKDSWTKLFCVPHMGDIGNATYTKVLCVSDDDHQVLLEIRSKLIVYNSRDGTFKTPEIQNITGWMVPEVYVESLISPS